MFGIALDEQQDDDYKTTVGDRLFVVEQKLVDMYKAFKIDFLDSWSGKGFQVRATRGNSSC